MVSPIKTFSLKEITNGRLVNVGMEVTGVPDAFSEGINYIRPGGRYVTMGNILFGLYTKIDPGFLTKKSVTIYPLNRYQPWYLGNALEFKSNTINKYPYADLMDAEFKFEEIEEALNKSLKREVTRASIVL